MVVVIDSAYKPTLKIFVNPKLDPEKYFPQYATEVSAGFDVKAHVPSVAFSSKIQNLNIDQRM